MAPLQVAPGAILLAISEMILHLVRHGETTYNAEHRIQGQTEAPLSELGRQQAEAVAAALAQRPIDALYSSPLRRALETARVIAERCRLPIQSDPRLMELHAGVFQGQLRSALEKSCPGELARWLAGEEDFAIPGGETRRQLMQRGCAAFRDIAAHGHEEAVIVTHGGLLSTVLRSLLNITEPLPPFSLKNGSITRLSVDREGRFSLLALNEVGHLAGIGYSNGGDL